MPRLLPKPLPLSVCNDGGLWPTTPALPAAPCPPASASPAAREATDPGSWDSISTSASRASPPSGSGGRAERPVRRGDASGSTAGARFAPCADARAAAWLGAYRRATPGALGFTIATEPPAAASARASETETPPPCSRESTRRRERSAQPGSRAERSEGGTPEGRHTRDVTGATGTAAADAGVAPGNACSRDRADGGGDKRAMPKTSGVSGLRMATEPPAAASARASETETPPPCSRESTRRRERSAQPGSRAERPDGGTPEGRHTREVTGAAAAASAPEGPPLGLPAGSRGDAVGSKAMPPPPAPPPSPPPCRAVTPGGGSSGRGGCVASRLGPGEASAARPDSGAAKGDAPRPRRSELCVGARPARRIAVSGDRAAPAATCTLGAGSASAAASARATRAVSGLA